MENDSYYVSVTGDVTFIGWTDQHGVQQLLELPTKDAHEFFRRGEIATRKPASLAGTLIRNFELWALRRRMFRLADLI